MALLIDSEQAACMLKIGMMAYRSQYIEDFPIVRRCIANTVGGQQRQVQTMGNTDGRLVTPFFLPLAMALKFDINILLSEEPNQLFCNFYCFRFTTAHQCRRHAAFLAACQADQSGSILFQVLERSCAFAFACFAHLEAGNQLAEVLISGARST